MQAPEAYERFMRKRVVLDTATSLIYIGTLVEADDYFIGLESADVHDVNEARVTKELHIMEATRDGVMQNRDRVYVKQDAVLSISLLTDVRVF